MAGLRGQASEELLGLQHSLEHGTALALEPRWERGPLDKPSDPEGKTPVPVSKPFKSDKGIVGHQSYPHPSMGHVALRPHPETHCLAKAVTLATGKTGTQPDS